MKKRFFRVIPWLISSIAALIIVYYLPPIHDHLSWRVENLLVTIRYWIKPPDQAVFHPSEQENPLTIDTVIGTTRAEFLLTLTPEATTTPQTDLVIEPTITSTPLPATVILDGVKYEDQHGRKNYCGPSNFSMALTFWGWDGNRDIIGKATMPINEKDKNVMPYELQEYITENVAGMGAIIRNGGDIETLKRLLSAGFPVVIEMGVYEVDINGKYSWMGHYGFVTGYDDAAQTFIYQDTYQPKPEKNPGPNRRMEYNKLIEGWRAFNYVFIVVYPLEKQNTLLPLLGPLADEEHANRHAIEVANVESQKLTGIDQFFAWFNIGTGHVALFEYTDAATAYDYAFNVYANLNENSSLRPYRMMWYQTGPYKAYYYTNRFSDVINLADTTLNDTIAEPVLEESLYWRGKANYMAGQTNPAIADYRAALKFHPNWVPAVQALQDLGVQP